MNDPSPVIDADGTTVREQRITDAIRNGDHDAHLDAVIDAAQARKQSVAPWNDLADLAQAGWKLEGAATQDVQRKHVAAIEAYRIGKKLVEHPNPLIVEAAKQLQDRAGALLGLHPGVRESVASSA